jgi:hypothetical protein
MARCILVILMMIEEEIYVDGYHDVCIYIYFFSYFLSPLASQRRSPLKGPSNRIEKLLELMEDKNIKIL